MTTCSSLLELGDTIWGGTDKIIAFLLRNGLLASSKDCSRSISLCKIYIQQSVFIHALQFTDAMSQCMSVHEMMSAIESVGTPHNVIQKIYS